MLKQINAWLHDAPKEPTSSIDTIISAEIKDDAFYVAIHDLACRADAGHILEIGSSSGQGSTDAFVKGIRQNPRRPILHCLEISRVRYKVLSDYYAADPQVRTYNVSSVPAEELPSPEIVADFYHNTHTNLNSCPLDLVLSWLQTDRAYMVRTSITDGIRYVLAENHIAKFDMVLIDGSEFTGERELERVIGARWILLDDVNAFKNYRNYRRLAQDPRYRLAQEDWRLRNGFAIFERVN